MPRFLWVTLLLVVLLSLSACGSSPEAESESPNGDEENLAVIAATPTPATQTTEQQDADPAPPPTATSAPEPTPAPEEEPAVAESAPAEAASNLTLIGEGEATRISDNFQGELMANGQPYDKDQLYAAHKELELGTVVRVTNLNTNQSVEVTVVDRMPAAAPSVIDVSRAAAVELGMPDMGTAVVRVELVQ